MYREMTIGTNNWWHQYDFNSKVKTTPNFGNPKTNEVRTDPNIKLNTRCIIKCIKRNKTHFNS